MFLVQEKPQWLDPIQFEEVDHKKIMQTWRNSNKPWKYFIFKSNFKVHLILSLFFETTENL